MNIRKSITRAIVAVFAMTCIIVTSGAEASHAAPAQTYGTKRYSVIIEDNTTIHYNGTKTWKLDLASTTWERLTLANITYGKCPTVVVGGQYCFRVSDTEGTHNGDLATGGITYRPNLGRPGRIILFQSHRFAGWSESKRQMIILHEMGHALIHANGHAPNTCKCLMQAQPGIYLTPQRYDILWINNVWYNGYTTV